MIAIMNAVGIAVGVALIARGIQLGDVLRGAIGVLCVVVNIGSFVRDLR
jgi:hypothetical protein